MQSAYPSPGGYLDGGLRYRRRRGNHRQAGTCSPGYPRRRHPGDFFQNGWDPEYREVAEPGSPDRFKSNALKTMRDRPEPRACLLAKGGWDYRLLDALVRRPGGAATFAP